MRHGGVSVRAFQTTMTASPQKNVAGHYAAGGKPSTTTPSPIPGSCEGQSKELLLRTILPEDLLLLVRLVLAACSEHDTRYNRTYANGTHRRGRITHLKRITTQKLDHYDHHNHNNRHFKIVLLLSLIIDATLIIIFKLFLFTPNLTLILLLEFELLVLTLLLFKLITLLLETEALVEFNLLKDLILKITLYNFSLFHKGLVEITLILNQTIVSTDRRQETRHEAGLLKREELLIQQDGKGIQHLVQIVLKDVKAENYIETKTIIETNTGKQVTQTNK